MGLGMLPAIVVSRELRHHPLKAPHRTGSSMDIATHILWHKNTWTSAAIAAFMGLVTEKLEEAEDAAPPRLPEGSFED
jgi:DNA-binding transcriptional LysR family regulator